MRKPKKCDCKVVMQEIAERIADTLNAECPDLSYMIILARNCPENGERSNVISVTDMSDESAKSAFDEIMKTPDDNVAPLGTMTH